MNWSLGNYWYLGLLLLLPILGFLIFNYLRWKNNKRNLFAESRFQDFLFEKTNWFTKIFPLLYLIGTLFLIFSIIDLLGGRQEIKVQQKTNNVYFVLDVSNSMNAQDVDPSRLDQAKNIVINSLKKMANDRVGIVVFAGEAYSIMPLTTDYTAAETYLSGIETNILQYQGTDFLKAIKVVAQKFQTINKGSRHVVLISDGEDNEGHQEQAIKLANSEGIKITTVGVGTDEGAPIPEYYFGQLMGYKTDFFGETVVSKRQTAALKDLAVSTGGIYIDGNRLDQAINNVLSDIATSNETSSTTVIDSQSAVHYYQYFLIVSFICFALIYLLNPKRDFNI